MTGETKLECIWCDVYLEFRGDHGFYKCPDCGGEWWPGPPDHGMDTLWKDEQKYKKSISKPGGSNKSKGRKEEKKKNKIHTDRYKLE